MELEFQVRLRLLYENKILERKFLFWYQNNMFISKNFAFKENDIMSHFRKMRLLKEKETL